MTESNRSRTFVADYGCLEKHKRGSEFLADTQLAA